MRIVNSRFPILLLAFSAVSPFAVEAQDESFALEEVVVTATRRQESEFDVAKSMSVVTARDLETRGITNFEDVKRIAAGLYLESPQGLSSASIRIRGVGSQGFSSVDPSVGVLVDGLYQPRIGTVFTDLLDIERIEVLRGPQGTLFGKNTTAGAILIHTRAPDLTRQDGQIQLVAGNLSDLEFRGSYSTPLIEDQLALRVSGFWAERDGFNDNRFLGIDSRNIDRQGGRLKLRWAPTDSLDLTYSFETSDNEYVADQGLTRYGTLDSTRAGDLSGAPLEQVSIALGRLLPAIGPFTREVFQGEQFAEDEVDRHVLNVQWDIAGHTVRSITGYEEVDSFLPADNDGTFLDLVQITSSPSTETFTQEFQLTNSGGEAWSYVLGFWYQDSEVDSQTLVGDPADIAMLEGRPQRPATPVTSDLGSETTAFFGDLTYDLSKQWSVGAGVRYTSDDKSASQTIAVFPVIDNLSQEFDEWTYQAGVEFRPSDRLMTYFSYDRGFKSGGFNRQETLCFIVGAPFCLPDDRLTFDSETTDSFEIGIKGSVAQLRFSAALFHQTYKDFQVTSKFPPTSTIIQNAAEVTSEGLEVDFQWTPTDELLIDGSVAFVDTEYDRFTNAPCSLVVDRSPTCTQDLSGRSLDNAPDTIANLGLEYRSDFTFNPSLSMFFRGDVSYRSEANLVATLAEDTVQPGYSLIDARFGLEGPDGRWTLSLWGRNLSDKEYHVIAGRPSGHVDGLTQVQGLPRTYGITLDWRF